jgi:hypothetical protein
VIDMLPETQWLDPDKYPYVSMMLQYGPPIAQTRMEYKWREQRLRQLMMEITVADAVAADEIEVSAADGALISPMTDHYLYNTTTDEHYLFVSESSGVLTIRQLSGATGAPLIATTIGDKIIIETESHAASEAPPGAFGQQEDPYYNYLMQIDKTVNVSDIEQAEEHYGGEDQRDRDRRSSWIEVMRGINLMCYIGQRSRETTSATNLRRHMTQGIFERVATNVLDFSMVGPGLSYAAFCEAVRPTTEPGSASPNKKKAFLGTNAYIHISSWGENKLRLSPESKTYGLAINDVLTPYGTVGLVRDISLSAQNGLADRGCLVDPAHMRWCYLRPVRKNGRIKGGNLRLVQDYDTTNPHQDKDLITGVIGQRIVLEENFAEWYNIT